MGFKDVLRTLFVVVVSFFGLCLCEGYKFYVGGRDGWVIKPSEDYNHWAERNRFQVNDTLLFKYKQGGDAVLVVTRDNYVHCYTKTPLQTLIEGGSEFKFNRSGPFYFISGNEDHCKQGQRLIVVVLAVRQRNTPPPPPPPSPAQQAPPPEVSSSPSLAPSSPILAPPPESGDDVSPSGSDGATSPAPAPKTNFAVRRVGGSFGLAALCLGFVGAIVFLNN